MSYASSSMSTLLVDFISTDEISVLHPRTNVSPRRKIEAVLDVLLVEVECLCIVHKNLES